MLESRNLDDQRFADIVREAEGRLPDRPRRAENDDFARRAHVSILDAVLARHERQCPSTEDKLAFNACRQRDGTFGGTNWHLLRKHAEISSPQA